MENHYQLDELKLELLYACPQECIHCSSEASPERKIMMAPDKVREILRSAKNLGVKKVVFSGGEPVLYPQLPEFIYYLTSNGIKSTVYTSGNVPHVTDELDTLCASGCDRFIFTLFSNNKNIHEAITQCGGWDTTVHAIKYSLELPVTTEVHFPVLADNVDELENTVHFISSLGVKRISALRFVPQGRGKEATQKLSHSQEMLLREKILKLREQGYDIRTGSPFNFLLLNNQPACRSGVDRLIIAPDFKIYPCDAFKHISPSYLGLGDELTDLGNHTLEEVWEKSPYLLTIREYLSTPFAKACSGCEFLDKCLSGCLAQKILKHHKLIKVPDPGCLRHELKK